MMLSLALLIVPPQAGPRIIETLRDKEGGMEGIIAERILVPAGTNGAAYARVLVERAGLASSRGVQEGVLGKNGTAGYHGVSADNGPLVIVYFARIATNAHVVCRIRAVRGRQTKAWYRASEWCGSTYGVRWSRRAPPLVKPPGSY
ncbi:hypothetical protein [Sphingomonas soli]|uniref:hypothetical protein n=1 Tax=Sphingomonas soli TaxID=266127 RepID=UPI00082C4387|nr:hypothetical protein [Sphingomonas soli]